MDQREETTDIRQTSLEVRLAAQVQAIRTVSNAQRQQRLNRFLHEVLQSGKLSRPHAADWPTHLYEDLYHEALQKTLIEICQKIDQYNEAHPVMAWVNFRLNCQLMEVIKDYQKQGMTQMPKSGGAFPVRLPSLEDLPLSTVPPETLDLQIQAFLQQDPEGLLQKERLRDHPEITFQRLAIAKFVEGQSWVELAEALNISAQTLCSFFNRQLKTLIPYFQRHLES